jgi:hypothetical protein
VSISVNDVISYSPKVGEALKRPPTCYNGTDYAHELSRAFI